MNNFNIENFLNLNNYEIIRQYRRKAKNNKTGKSTAEFFTPYSIVKRMGDKIPESDWADPTKTFLEPCFGNGGKKFDICMMNPPYDGNLHLRFLEKVIEVTNEVVTIQPVRWLQDSLVKYKKSTAYKKYENSISKHISSLDTLKALNARKDFGIGTMMDLGIYVCNSEGGFDYENYSGNKFVDDIIQKSPYTIQDHVEIGKDDGIRVKIRALLPSGDGRSIKMAYCGIGQNEEIIIDGLLENGKPWQSLSGMNKNKKKLGWSIKFKTKDEAKNFLNSFYTNFMIYLYSQAFNDQHVYFFAIPFMEDYTKPWTDERFFEYFKIDKDKQEEIINYISERS